MYGPHVGRGSLSACVCMCVCVCVSVSVCFWNVRVPVCARVYGCARRYPHLSVSSFHFLRGVQQIAHLLVINLNVRGVRAVCALGG